MKRNCNCTNHTCVPEPPYRGQDGLTPFIGENGNWWIGINDTGVKASGSDGVTPHIGVNGNWFIGTTDTGVNAKGENGLTPFIGTNGNWWIGTADTGVKAAGANGITPHIGINGNWFVGTTDTGVKATGSPGVAATITVGTTTTLPDGSPATVVNTGTSSAAVLNFGIPQGIPGTGGSSNLAHASMYGILLNDADMPSTVASGAKIPWKVLNNNGAGLITSPAATPYFQFTKTGRYMCVFSLRCATKISGDNGVAIWGIESQSIKKQMVTSASAFVTPNMTNIAGTGFFDVTDVNEHYNFVNNSKMSLQCQGSTAAQNSNNAFKDLGGVNQVDGMSCTFLRIGDAFPLA